MIRYMFVLLVVLTTVPAAAITDLDGVEVPFHTAVESFLSMLAGAAEEGMEGPLLEAIGLESTGRLALDLTTLHDRVVAPYAAALQAGEDPEDAYCEKARAIGQGLAAAHAAERAKRCDTIPWKVLLRLIDYKTRSGISLRSDRSPEEFREVHRRLNTCWAEGVWAIYPGEEVAP